MFEVPGQNENRMHSFNLHLILRVYVKMSVIHAIEANEADLGSITFKCNRLHYNYFAIFMITLHYDYINFQM